MTPAQIRAALGTMDMSDTLLPMLVIYAWPEHVVIRRTDLIRDEYGHREARPWPSCVLCTSLEQAREGIRATFPHLNVILRRPEDAPQIVETWL